MPRNTQNSRRGVCRVCNTDERNDVEFGELMQSKSMVAHYFCLLLSSNLYQKGQDDEGILGFLPQDIKTEIDRAQKLTCCYCQKRGANIGCCNQRCRQSFHMPCGVKNKCLSEFTGVFRSFCRKHSNQFACAPGEEHKTDDLCRICLDVMGTYDAVESLRSPCCSRDVWYHKRCMMQTAKAAGYFFKCPICKNENDFRDVMTKRGIYIPDSDAIWENGPNAYAEMTLREECMDERCDRPKYSTEDEHGEDGDFVFVTCDDCGVCYHRRCVVQLTPDECLNRSSYSSDSDDSEGSIYLCHDCHEFDRKMQNNRAHSCDGSMQSNASTGSDHMDDGVAFGGDGFFSSDFLRWVKNANHKSIVMAAENTESIVHDANSSIDENRGSLTVARAGNNAERIPLSPIKHQNKDMSKGSRSFYELTMALAHKAMQTNSAIWNMTSTTKSQFNANNNKCIQLLEMSMKTATPEKSTNEPLFTNSQRAGQKPTEHNSSFQPLSAKATATTSTATNLPRRMNLQSGQKFRIKLAAIRKLKSQDEDQILRKYPHLQLKRCFVSLVRVDEAAIAADKRKISNVPDKTKEPHIVDGLKRKRNSEEMQETQESVSVADDQRQAKRARQTTD